MALNLRVTLVLSAVVAALALMVYTANAAPGNDTRPGWGYGDKNHEHTGPPGQSVHP